MLLGAGGCRGGGTPDCGGGSKGAFDTATVVSPCESPLPSDFASALISCGLNSTLGRRLDFLLFCFSFACLLEPLGSSSPGFLSRISLRDSTFDSCADLTCFSPGCGVFGSFLPTFSGRADVEILTPIRGGGGGDRDGGDFAVDSDVDDGGGGCGGDSEEEEEEEEEEDGGGGRGGALDGEDIEDLAEVFFSSAWFPVCGGGGADFGCGVLGKRDTSVPGADASIVICLRGLGFTVPSAPSFSKVRADDASLPETFSLAKILSVMLDARRNCSSLGPCPPLPSASAPSLC